MEKIVKVCKIIHGKPVSFYNVQHFLKLLNVFQNQVIIVYRLGLGFIDSHMIEILDKVYEIELDTPCWMSHHVPLDVYKYAEDTLWGIGETQDVN